MLWTDADSREFIAQNYRWFLDTFDSYPYGIQRADAIRYFILHHYGGIYMDLDIGCLRRLDPLLIFPVILPRTIPVGVSNDLIFAEKEHPFMAQTIHNLITFDHNWILNYPTVMFSTGPMFLSAQYGLYTSSQPLTPGGEVRILPKSLYGKNAKPEEAPHSFFTHLYGSSWHSDDAAFIGFLGSWGKTLMWIGLVILIVSLVKLGYGNSKQRQYGFGSVGGYDVLLPRWVERNGRWHLDMGWLSLPGRTSLTPPSALSTRHPGTVLDDADSFDEEDVQLLPLSLNVRPSSPASDISTDDGDVAHPGIVAMRRMGRRVSSLFSSSQPPNRSQQRRGVMFFLPAFSTSTGGVTLPGDDTRTQPALTPRSLSQRSFYRADKYTPPADFEAGSDTQSEGSSTGRSAVSTPQYEDVVIATPFRPPAGNTDASGTRRPHSTANPWMS
jgi:hypothetical protein